MIGCRPLVPDDLNQSNCGKDLEEKRIYEQKLAKAAKDGHIYASGENARVSNQNKSCDSGVPAMPGWAKPHGDGLQISILGYPFRWRNHNL